MKGEREMFGMGQREVVVRVMSERMDRRRVLRAAAAVGAAAVAGGVLKAMPAGATAGYNTKWKTTSNLNLRAKPSLSGKVLLVIPKGAVVTDEGYLQNGFMNVKYQGTVGWASRDYLTKVENDQQFIGNGVTTANVNLRQGPSTSDQILKVVPKGTTVDVFDKTANGFRYVVAGGKAGWMYEAYLEF
jgi:zinc D-Ala-D-Ala carboxypeptidase